MEKNFVKWLGGIPTSVESLKTKEGAYNYSEMLEIMNGVEWKQTINFVG